MSEFRPHANGYTRPVPGATRIVTCAPIQDLFYLSNASRPASGGFCGTVVIIGYTHCLQK